jgi:prophage regulatory protein
MSLSKTAAHFWATCIDRRSQVFAADCTPRYEDEKMLLRARNCLLCLDQEQSAGGSVSMREPDRIIRLKTVLSRTGLSRSTIYRKIAEGTFPAQIRISANGAGWRESDINRWIADPVSWRPKHQRDEVG